MIFVLIFTSVLFHGITFTSARLGALSPNGLIDSLGFGVLASKAPQAERSDGTMELIFRADIVLFFKPKELGGAGS
ncbi:hypothetical protein BCR34DRAFT_374325 [Clohesyomyces aquaticus]|uniref:Uncharacterized protein n=1 Tax=Clohesyomyces aquaticus TaxID=1231657 RepID=A0A1Y1ZGJ4_9PLEO|nr:hypothetical protein BCR34DRAFT_374325 [Clohesyomyces aquaticus]